MIEERTKANVRVLKLAYGGLLVALGILLPQAFHIFGQNAGMIFLPIQIPVLFAGMLLGPYYGGLIGILVPLFSSVLTGMPPVPKVYFYMIFFKPVIHLNEVGNHLRLRHQLTIPRFPIIRWTGKESFYLFCIQKLTDWRVSLCHNCTHFLHQDRFICFIVRLWIRRFLSE